MKHFILKCISKVFFSLIILSTSVMAVGSDFELDVLEYHLDNGLTILILPRQKSPTFSIYMHYRVGGANEVTGKTGLAHFIEHLMSKGTPELGTTDYEAEIPLMEQKDVLWRKLSAELRTYAPDRNLVAELTEKFDKLEKAHRKLIVSNEMDKIYLQNGAYRMNASTSFDWTNYFMSLPRNKLKLWCSIESEVMLRPVFREFYTERQVILEERRMRYDTQPWSRMFEQLLAAAYTYHPYGRLVIGASSDIEGFTRKDVEEFYRLYYAPNQAVISIVGDVDPDASVAMIKEYFGDIPRQPDPPPVVTVEPEQQGLRRVEVLFDSSPELGIAYHTCGMEDVDKPALDVMAEILVNGRTSRLYKRLVDEMQIAVEVSAGEFSLKHPGLFFVFATPRAPHTVEELEKVIYEEIERMKTGPVSDWELTKIKNQIEADFIKSLESDSGLARALGKYETLSEWEYINKIYRTRKLVGPKDITRVAQKYFKRENRTVSVLVKSESDK
jgi:predicted Zn-dependent peptidase